MDALLKQFAEGNTNPGIGNKSLGSGIFYLRGRNGGRVFLRQIGLHHFEILGKADKSNEQRVINKILELYGD